jgi:nucleotide-binding universal stress UspA family protein
MSRVIAAIDNTAAARPVLAAGATISRFLEADLEAVHVREDGDATVRAAAKAARVPLQELVIGGRSQSKVGALLEAAAARDVEAVVVGARASRIGRLPAGHVALELIVSLRKPLVVVPPHAAVADSLRRILVPLDGAPATAAALARTIELAQGSAVEVIALHIHEHHTLPLFSEQPQHELEAWRREFIARNCPGAEEARLEVRVGIPGEHVLRAAAESDADLIALAWAQNLQEGRAAVVREALERSDLPILLVAVSEEP